MLPAVESLAFLVEVEVAHQDIHIKNIRTITHSPGNGNDNDADARTPGVIRTGLRNIPSCSTIHFSMSLINRPRRYPHVPKQIRVPNMTFPGNAASEPLQIYRRIVIPSRYVNTVANLFFPSPHVSTLYKGLWPRR